MGDRKNSGAPAPETKGFEEDLDARATKRAAFVAEASAKGYSAEAAERIADERLTYDDLVADGVSEEEAAALVWPRGASPDPEQPKEGELGEGTDAELERALESGNRSVSADLSGTAAAKSTAPPASGSAPEAGEESEEGELVLDATLHQMRAGELVEFKPGTPVAELGLSETEIDQLTALRHIVLRPPATAVASEVESGAKS